MILFLSIDAPDQITIRFRMEDGKGLVAEGKDLIHPGENFLGVTFEEMYKHGAGKLEIKEAKQ